MVAVPPATPAVTVVGEPEDTTVATIAFPLLHVPPSSASLKVSVLPGHIPVVPPNIAGGVPFSYKVYTAGHPATV